MPIPQLHPKFEVRAKVRIGEKRLSSQGREYPASVDYFLSDDPEVQGQPKALRVTFPYGEIDENFPTGLEWWVRGKDGRGQLACYTHDGGDTPVAFRQAHYRADWNQRAGDDTRSGRIPILCPSKDCPDLLENRCKPMGRL